MCLANSHVNTTAQETLTYVGLLLRSLCHCGRMLCAGEEAEQRAGQYMRSEGPVVASDSLAS